MSNSHSIGQLPEGTPIGEFRVVRVLGEGGFGITYMAESNYEFEVAIKEYMPSAFAVRDGLEVRPKSKESQEDFEWGREQFLIEAKTLKKFKHPNIVRIITLAKKFNTAYIFMAYEDGEPLDKYLGRRGALTEAELTPILFPLAEGLCEVHRQGVWHRDIKPANVFVRSSDGSPVLLDFGAARNDMGVRSKSIEAIVSPPYSPPEQYDSEGALGPSTDIYALSALCYQAITGESPAESPLRQRRVFRGEKDPLRSLAERATPGYSMPLLKAVDWGLRLHEDERPQSVEKWLGLLKAKSFASVAPSRSESLVALNEGARRGAENVPRRVVPEPIVRGAEEAGHNRSLRAKFGRGVGVFHKPAWIVVALGIAMLMLLVFILGQDRVDELGAWLGSPAAPATSRLPPPPRVQSFAVTNRSAQKIVVVRAAPTAMDDYGDNKLGTETISPGRKRRVLLDKYGYGDACEFDVFINAEDGQTYDERKKDLCRDDEVVYGGDSNEDRSSVLDSHGGSTSVTPAPQPTIDCLTCQPLTVRTGPGDARVQITNIGPRYEPGMKLPPGTYDIRVTADGFETVERTLRHDDEPTDEWLALPFQDCPVCPKMVELPMGSYSMGTSRGRWRFPNEGPAHKVEIQYRLAVAAFEVSFEEWDACVDDRGCKRHLRDEGRGRGTLPAVHATVADTKEYIDWLTVRTDRPYRLLSEAEWEYAARAGIPAGRHWGNRLEDQCVYENGADVTAQGEYSDWTVVGCTDGHVYAAPSDEERFRSNPWGLHHMLGNVAEWTADCWHNNYVGAPGDGSTWKDNCDLENRQHVVRGGSWSSGPREVRAPTRLRRDPTERKNNIGFRVAVEIGR